MVLFALVVARLLWLQVIDVPNLSTKAQSLHTTNVTLTAKRGTIFDRNGNVLATSVECRTIYCNPKEVTQQPRRRAQESLQMSWGHGGLLTC